MKNTQVDALERSIVFKNTERGSRSGPPGPSIPCRLIHRSATPALFISPERTS